MGVDLGIKKRLDTLRAWVIQTFLAASEAHAKSAANAHPPTILAHTGTDPAPSRSLAEFHPPPFMRSVEQTSPPVTTPPSEPPQRAHTNPNMQLVIGEKLNNVDPRARTLVPRWPRPRLILCVGSDPEDLPDGYRPASEL